MHQPVYWLHDPWLALAAWSCGTGGLAAGQSGDPVVVTEFVTPGCAVRDYALRLFPEMEFGPVGKGLPEVPKSRC